VFLFITFSFPLAFALISCAEVFSQLAFRPYVVRDLASRIGHAGEPSGRVSAQTPTVDSVAAPSGNHQHHDNGQ
jgi:hypothetical protein